MKRKEMSIWVAFAAGFLAILFFTFRQKAVEPQGMKAREDFYRRAMGEFNPADYHSQRAYAFEADHSFERAAEEYKKLLKLKPDDKDLHSHLGEVYYKMGMKDQAIAQIKEVLRLDPSNWVQQESLGDVYAEKGDSDEAILQYEKALMLNRENALCNCKLGRLYYQRADYYSALRAFGRSLEIDPGLAESHLGLGLSYCALGNRTGASAEVKKLENLKKKDMAAQLSEEIVRVGAR